MIYDKEYKCYILEKDDNPEDKPYGEFILDMLIEYIPNKDEHINRLISSLRSELKDLKGWANEALDDLPPMGGIHDD